MGNRTFIFLFFIMVLNFSFRAEAANKNCPAALSSQDLYFCGVHIDDENGLGCVNYATAIETTADFVAACKKYPGSVSAWRLTRKIYNLSGVSNNQYLCSKAPKKEKICMGQGFRWDSQKQNCYFPPSTISSVRVACSESNKAEINKPEPPPPCELKDAKWMKDPSGESDSEGCYCDNKGAIDIPKVRCNQEKAEVPPEASTAGEPSEPVVQCAEKFKEKVNQCKEQAEQAVSNCDKDNGNANIDSAKKFVGTIAKALINKASGSGAQMQCAGASLLSSGTYNLLDQLKTKCDNNITDCLSTCNEIQMGIVEACLGESIQPKDIIKDSMSPDQIYLITEEEKLSPLIAESFKQCKVNGIEKQNLLKDAMLVTDNAAQSARECACKLSSNQGDCLNLSSPAECSVNPQLPGCSSPLSLGCALGSADYATSKCQCLRDPSMGICKSVSGKLPSAFAMDLKAIDASGGGGGITGGSSGLGTGDMDLGGFNQNDARSDDSKDSQGAGGGINYASPASGGGGSGSSGGGDAGASGVNAEAGGGAEPADKNLGIFGLAKSAVSSLFGKKNAPSGKVYRNKNFATPDPEKWRPRGLASVGCKASQIRCKNETIWEIMSSRYGSNETSFIQNP